MTITLFQSSVPGLLRALRNLRHVLSLGQAHAEAKGIETSVLLQTRLIPDMFPLVRQVQIACDLAKNGAARLAGVEPLKFEDTEADFTQLYARIDRAIEYIQSFGPAQIDGNEDNPVTVPTRGNGDLNFTAQSYLLQFTLPNVFFHISMTYAILRQAGVALGKADYIGAIAQHSDA